eukprot:Gb_11804 [translate_table: standard]
MAMTAFSAPASLYVGDLDGEMTDRQLIDLFVQIGALASVRVCRDSVSGRSLGYGYVNYIDPAHAARALDVLNHTSINGKPIRIMWSHRDPNARKSGIGNIFIKNLHESIGNANLHDTFSKFGNILSCKVATQDGKSKGYGFVHFETEEAAMTAIEKVNGMMMEGKQVYVGKFMKRNERTGSAADLKFTNLYIKNLEQDVTEELLHGKFSTFGKISNLVIMKDENGNSKGFGFINFDNPDDAKKAVESMNGSQLGTKAIYVGRAQKKAEREQMLRRQFEEKRHEQMLKYQGSNLYVKNIDDAVDDEELREVFGHCGTITSAKIMRDEKGLSKGFGFVCFTTPEEANKALADLSGHMLRGKPVYVAIAQRKEVRRAQLQARYAIAGIAGPPGAVVPAGYPAMYYAPPPGVVSQIPQRPGIMYQPLGLRPGWRPPGGLPASIRPGFQPMPLAVISNNQRQQRQPRGRLNGPLLPQAGQPMTLMPHLQQQTQPSVAYKDIAGNQQRPWQPVKYMPNGRPREMNNSLQSSVPITSFTPQTALNAPGAAVGANSVPVLNQGAEMLSSTLAAASPQEQKQILGERLFPLVQQHQFELAGKITGMLLEMDNSELLLLLESPDSLAAKVEEAVQVLKLSKSRVSAQDVLPGNYLSGEVVVS